MVCSAFDVVRSCYYAHRLRRCRVDARRVALRSQVNQLFNQSRGSAGSRSILGMLREDGVSIGRFRVRRLMRELGLVSKQPGSHAYKQATVERPDIPNRLNRAFATRTTQPGLVRRYHIHLGARPLELLSGGAGSACTTSNWLGILRQAGYGVGHQGAGYGLRATRQTAAGAVSFRSGQPVRQPPVSAAVVAISDGTEHEPSR